MNNYKKGEIVTGKVTGIKKYGFFMSIEPDLTGLVHISEISDCFVKNVSDYVSINDSISATILDIDEKNKKLKLSIKDLNYQKNKKKNGIIETKSGFNNLSKSLEKWINIKEEEIRKNQKKV